MTRWLPLFSFLFGYIALSGIGSLLLLWGIEPFYTSFATFAGAYVPVLSADGTTTFFIVLIGSPVLFAAGYWASTILLRSASLTLHFDIKITHRGCIFLFLALIGTALLSLARGGAFEHLSAWTSFSQFLGSRNQLFDAISFPEFVNIYSLVPTVAALTLITSRSQSLRERAVHSIPAMLAVALQLLLFQKMPALMAIVLMGAIWMGSKVLSGDPIPSKRRVAALAAISIALYLAMVIVPFALPKLTGRHNVSVSEVAYTSAGYAGSSILMRLAPGLINYVAVFPNKHPFYEIDLGPWFRRGAAPDEAAVIWSEMYPTMAGNSAAPMNFVFYSQGGAVVSLIASAIVGAAIGALWQIALGCIGAHLLRSALGGILIAFSFHLSIDSLRNSVIVSYGYAWPVLFVLAVTVISLIFSRSTTSGASSSNIAT